MAFKKRLTQKQRLSKQLPKGWKATLGHPLMKKLTYGDNFNPTPSNVVKAISLTKGWKGATYTQKLFVLCLDLLMEKAYGTGVLEPDTYNRLQDHMESNQTKMQTESYATWMTWCWDYYHDHYNLHDMENGTLPLSTVKEKPIRKKVKPKPKRKRIRSLR